MTYLVERHERHIVLWIAERRWVLRDEAELELMLGVFDPAGSQDLRERAFRASSLFAAVADAPTANTETLGTPILSTKPATNDE